VIPALAVCSGLVTDWTQLWDALAADADGYRHQLPWYANYRLALPLAADLHRVQVLAKRLRRGLEAAGVRLRAIQSRAIFPQQLNDLIERHGSKGAVLSESTLRLLAEMLAPLNDAPALVVCDKHGGRNRYGEFLHEQFPDWLIEVCQESRAQSVYRWGPAAARVEVWFCTGGEAFLPAALASMASKYLRELAMRAVNDFWCRQVSGLEPTAGYPVDATRFKAEIAACQARLGIEDRALWRMR
jgi:hypothetical protein